MINYKSEDKPERAPKNIYLYNVMTAWEIRANSEEEAFERLPGALETRYAEVIDQDVLLVEVVPNGID